MFGKFKEWRRKRKAEKEEIKTRHEAVTGFSPEEVETQDHKAAYLYLINNLWEHIEKNLYLSLTYWERIPKNGAVDAFRSYASDLYQHLKELSEVLGKEIKHNKFSADIIITEEVEFLERIQALPGSLQHHTNEVPQLAQKEKEITEKLREYHREMLKVVKASVDLFETKDRPINFIVVIRKHLDYYYKHKDEYNVSVKEFKEIKEKLDRLSRILLREIENYFKELEEQIKSLYDKLSNIYIYFFFHLFEPHAPPSLWQSSNPKRILKEKYNGSNSIFSSLGKKRGIVIEELIPEIDKFLEIITLKFNYFNNNIYLKNLKQSLINLKFNLKTFLENDKKSFDLHNYLKKRVVSHFSQEKGVTKILYSGQIGSGKYLKDNKIIFSANSPRGIGGITSWSIAFSLGAEEQYGQYGFLFDILSLVENKQFSLSTNTGGSNLFNELHLFDPNFIPGDSNSPGASILIKKSYGIFPENGKYTKEVLGRFAENDYSLIDAYKKNRDFKFTIYLAKHTYI